MKHSRKIPLLLFFHLLILCSLVRAELPAKENFVFLTHNHNRSAVENGLDVFISTGGLSFSFLADQVFWYLACETTGVVLNWAARHRLRNTGQRKKADVWTDVCLQLAAPLSTTELALSGYCAPWPVNQLWWQFLRFSGALMAVYIACRTGTEKKLSVPFIILTYLAAEKSARASGGAITDLFLRTDETEDINPVYYGFGQYIILSMSTGLIAGCFIDEFLVGKGLKSIPSPWVFMISALAIAAMSATGTLFFIGEQISFLNLVGASAIAGIGAFVVAGVLVEAKGKVLAEAATEVGAFAGTIALAGASAGAGAANAIEAGAGAGIVIGVAAGVVFCVDAVHSCVAALAGTSVFLATVGTSILGKAFAGAVGGIVSVTMAVGIVGLSNLLTYFSSRVNLKDSAMKKAVLTLTPALGFALYNSLCNYAIYGTPIENSLSEMAWTLWKKIFAPRDYLIILFN